MVFLGAAEIVCAVAFAGKPLTFAVVLMTPVALGIAASEWSLLRPAGRRLV